MNELQLVVGIICHCQEGRDDEGVGLSQFFCTAANSAGQGARRGWLKKSEERRQLAKSGAVGWTKERRSE